MHREAIVAAVTVEKAPRKGTLSWTVFTHSHTQSTMSLRSYLFLVHKIDKALLVSFVVTSWGIMVYTLTDVSQRSQRVLLDRKNVQ